MTAWQTYSTQYNQLLEQLDPVFRNLFICKRESPTDKWRDLLSWLVPKYSMPPPASHQKCAIHGIWPVLVHSFCTAQQTLDHNRISLVFLHMFCQWIQSRTAKNPQKNLYSYTALTQQTHFNVPRNQTQKEESKSFHCHNHTDQPPELTSETWAHMNSWALGSRDEQTHSNHLANTRVHKRVI